MKKMLGCFAMVSGFTFAHAADIGGINLGDDLGVARQKIAAALPGARVQEVTVNFTVPINNQGVTAKGVFKTYSYSLPDGTSWAISASPLTNKVWMMKKAQDKTEKARMSVASLLNGVSKFGTVQNERVKLNTGGYGAYVQEWAKNAQGQDLLPANGQCAADYSKIRPGQDVSPLYIPVRINPQCAAVYGVEAWGKEGMVEHYYVWASDPVAFDAWYQSLAGEKQRQLANEAKQSSKPSF